MDGQKENLQDNTASTEQASKIMLRNQYVTAAMPRNPLRLAVLATVLSIFYYFFLPIGAIIVVMMALMRTSWIENASLILALVFPIIPTVLYAITIVRLLIHKMSIPLALVLCVILHLFGSGLLCICIFNIMFAGPYSQIDINPLFVFGVIISCAIIMCVLLKDLTSRSTS